MLRRSLSASVAGLLFLSMFLVPATTFGAPAAHLVISEVLYDPAAPEPGAEFIEVYNPTDQTMSIAGWTIKDNSSSDALPEVTVEPGQFLVIASDQAEFTAANPGFAGSLIGLGSPIGNGLSNSGDNVRLVDAAGAVVDAMSYGSDASAFDPTCSDVPEGQSLSRQAPAADSDAAADWSAGVPSPGGPWAPLPAPTATSSVTSSPSPTATGTPSATPSLTAIPTATHTPSLTPTVTVGPSLTASPSATPDPVHSPTASPTPTPPDIPWPQLLLSEVFYDSAQSGADAVFEFVELFNPTGKTASTEGWSLKDNGGEDALPTVDIPAGSYLVIAHSRDGFLTNFPAYQGDLVTLEGPIGNGLSNTGDRIILLAPDKTEIDTMSYGSDATVFDPACADVEEGQSLARVPSGHDSDAAADWHSQAAPNPGQAGLIPSTPTPTPTPTLKPTRTPTVTKTPTRTRTLTPTRTPTLTQTPHPSVTATFTPTPTATASTAIATTTVTPTPSPTPTRPSRPPKVVLSEVLYDPIQEGSDAGWEFVEIWNRDELPVTLSGWRIEDNSSEDLLPEITLRVGELAVISAKEDAFRDAYPTFQGILVVLGGNIGNGLSNSGDVVRLIGADGVVVDAMSYGSEKSVFDPPCPKVRPGESLVRWRESDTDSAADWITDPQPSPGVRTELNPTPTSTFTPTVVLSRTPTTTPTPTVGYTPTTTSTRTATATATTTPTVTPLPPAALKVMLNEILPDPAHMDWDHDGQAGFMDEWIELYNGANVAVPLEGWQVGDEAAAYRIPAGVVIWPRSHLLLYRTQTRLSLSDWRDQVTLTRSDGGRADVFAYDRGPGEDRSFCRYGDGTGAWTSDCQVTPGEPNRLLPPPPPSPPTVQPTPTAAVPQTIAAARLAKEDTRVMITGSVTLPPGLIDKTIYLQDATGGMKIYLRKGDYGEIKLGDRLRVTGWMRNFYGETEISVPDPSFLTVLGPGKPVSPKSIMASGLGELTEGQFVQVAGVVVKYERHALILRDRDGLIRIYIPESLPWRRPYVLIGDLWAAQGVVGQSIGEKSTDAGYRIIPRFKEDLVRGPLTLPVTGGGASR